MVLSLLLVGKFSYADQISTAYMRSDIGLSLSECITAGTEVANKLGIEITKGNENINSSMIGGKDKKNTYFQMSCITNEKGLTDVVYYLFNNPNREERKKLISEYGEKFSYEIEKRYDKKMSPKSVSL